MKLFLVLIILLFFNVNCFSQTQWELNDKTDKEYKNADTEMTNTYKKVLKKITITTQKQLLLESQRIWIKFKESHCKAIANLYDGGSMQPMVRNQCLTEITKERTKQLLAYFESAL